MPISVRRCSANPLITPEDVKPSRPDLTVIGVFNAGIAVHNDEVVALLRVAEAARDSTPERPVVVDAIGGQINLRTLDRAELQGEGWDFSDPRTVRRPLPDGRLTVAHLTSISHLRIARSADGQTFRIDDEPAIQPEVPAEEWGCEDPRITHVGDRFMVTYSAVSRRGIATMAATSADLVTFTRQGLMLAPENRNVAVFPERIGDYFYAMHRPVPQMFGSPAIWIAQSPDLAHWGAHSIITGTSAAGWESARIGAAAPPIRTEAGWLFLYHAADEANRYCVGAMLLDLAEPRRVTHRLAEPILVPEADYETNGFFSEVVFSCGAVQWRGDLWVYYGAADRSFAGARFQTDEIIRALLDSPARDREQA